MLEICQFACHALILVLTVDTTVLVVSAVELVFICMVMYVLEIALLDCSKV